MAFGEQDTEILKTLIGFGFQPKVIYDIGASNGLWTWAAFQAFPEARYECFEPLATVNEVYAKGWFPPKEFMGNTTLHQVAVSDTEGTAKFFVLGVAGVGSTLIGESAEDKQEIEVPTRTLDGMIQSGELPPPSLIKLDIQGGELNALMGGRDLAMPSADVIMLEAWIMRGYGPETPLLHEMLNFFAREGFYVWEFGDEYRDDKDVLITKDVWLVRASSELGKAIWGFRLGWL